MDVTVVDLGVGNTASVMFALERLGAKAQLTRDGAAIAEASRLVLPGVGAAAFAMEQIGQANLAGILCRFARPLLGICLGQQLLYQSSEEGDAGGLARISGRVRRLEAAPDRPVPHMGWNRLRRKRDDPLLEGVDDGAFVYFVHGYACPIGNATLASADYGGAFSAVVRAGNVWGCQFHPERSSTAGRRILENFLMLPC
ncbi:MAG TPA: imidazole glycerol phosphate synthase subunit HisH [Rhizomicrobium sp.]